MKVKMEDKKQLVLAAVGVVVVLTLLYWAIS